VVIRLPGVAGLILGRGMEEGSARTEKGIFSDFLPERPMLKYKDKASSKRWNRPIGKEVGR